ncbi:UNVERIFIED_CONTAM: hypothetical protein Sradi_2650600 [Sesamum radiatum]|uniref:Uncharacterized protein n=1 Tax=Sesamum radiatum TaxID=300843 RepID=A0AAW2S5E1_SESRA
MSALVAGDGDGQNNEKIREIGGFVLQSKDASVGHVDGRKIKGLAAMGCRNVRSGRRRWWLATVGGGEDRG